MDTHEIRGYDFTLSLSALTRMYVAAARVAVSPPSYYD